MNENPLPTLLGVRILLCNTQRLWSVEFLLKDIQHSRFTFGESLHIKPLTKYSLFYTVQQSVYISNCCPEYVL